MTNTHRSFQVVGGDVALVGNYGLFQRSQTKVGNVVLEAANNDSIKLTATVNHEAIDSLRQTPSLICFMNTTQDVSDTSYLQMYRFTYEGVSGGTVEVTFPINSSKFPSGSQLFMVVYGIAPDEFLYHRYSDIDKQYPSIGEPSNVASITIPGN